MPAAWFPHFPVWVWWACTASNVLFGGQLVALAILWWLVAQRRTAALRRLQPPELPDPPSVAAPVVNDKAPLTPFVPALAVRMLKTPLDVREP